MTYEISDWNKMCNKECEKLPQSCECPLDCYKLTPKNVARSTFFCARSTWDLVADGGGTVMVWMGRWGWWYYLKGTYLYNSVHACVVLRWCRWADGVWGSLTWALIPQSALVRQSLNFKPNWSRWFKGLDKGITVASSGKRQHDGWGTKGSFPDTTKKIQVSHLRLINSIRQGSFF